jgi:hypothetical protein
MMVCVIPHLSSMVRGQLQVDSVHTQEEEEKRKYTHSVTILTRLLTLFVSKTVKLQKV